VCGLESESRIKQDCVFYLMSWCFSRRSWCAAGLKGQVSHIYKTNYMEENPCFEVNSSSACQQIPRVLQGSRFVKACTRAHHWTPIQSQINVVHIWYCISLSSISVLSFHSFLGFWSGLFYSVSPINIFYNFLYSLVEFVLHIMSTASFLLLEVPSTEYLVCCNANFWNGSDSNTISYRI
jgi:hypothetical protein